MKRKYPFKTWMQWHGASSADQPLNEERRGTTIIVVLALMTMLMVLGFVFFTLASEENINAQNFAEAAKVGIPATDDFFEYTLRQIILGANHTEKASPLWDGRPSLMASLFGRDIQPFSGPGVNLGWNSTTNRPFVDQDFDGTPDPNQDYLNTNNSPAARNAEGSLIGAGYLNTFPNPDVSYTYPGINNTFLAYDAEVPDAADVNQRIISPSYLRLQLLRNMTDSVGNPIPSDQWFSHPETAGMVARPHVEHRAITGGEKKISGIRRFVSNTYPQGGMTSFPFDPTQLRFGAWANHTKVVAGVTQFDYQLDADADGDGIKESIWMDLGFPMLKLPNGTEYVPMAAVKIIDADGLFNLNAHGNSAGMYTRRDNPASFIPTITPFRDPFLDFGPDGEVGVINVDDDGAGGNDIEDFTWVGSDDKRFLSRSNLGVSRSEINPQWGLYASSGGAFDQHNRYYGHDPVKSSDNRIMSYELSNMEWWWLMTGRPEFETSGAIAQLHDGRYGETARMDAAFGPQNPLSFPFPGPGVTASTPPLTAFGFSPNNPAHRNSDDNNNIYEGFQPYSLNPPIGIDNSDNLYYDRLGRGFPTFVKFSPFGHPLDLRGTGSLVARNVVTPTASYKQRQLGRYGRLQWPQYTDYFGHPFERYRQNVDLKLSNNGPDGLPGTADDVKFLKNYTQGYLVDEATEMILEPNINNDVDSIFGADENVPLHLSSNDLSTINHQGRVTTLAPYNFDSSDQSDIIRPQYTSTSWDLKSLSKLMPGPGAPLYRSWEFNADTDDNGGNGLLEFPPAFGSTGGSSYLDPFRPELRGLLKMEQNNISQPKLQPRKLMRRLSINGVLDTDRPLLPNGRLHSEARLRFRPLTPHPFSLGNTQVAKTLIDTGISLPTHPSQLTNNNFSTQESLARRDRQKMARDIYVLLYTLCGGNDGKDYTGDNSTELIYSKTPYDPALPNSRGDELRLMAQFAVNVVDALDPDDVITVFEYDTNLGNGWNLDDVSHHDSEDYNGDGMLTAGEDYDGDGNLDIEPVAEREVVYGLETQTLTLSEALMFREVQLATDNTFTEYDDTTRNHHFAYFELRNVSQMPVQFDNAAWRIRIKIEDDTIPERRLIFGPNAEKDSSGAMLSNGLPPGTFYTVGTVDSTLVTDTAGTNQPYSIFKVDHANLSDFTNPTTFIAPRRDDPSDNLNLDLVKELNTPVGNTFWVTDDNGNDLSATAGSLLDGGVTTLSIPVHQINTGNVLEVILERRTHLGRTQPLSFDDNSDQNLDNPWVEVDRMELDDTDFTNFDITDMTSSSSMPTLATQLGKLKSHVRRKPLSRNSEVLTNISFKPNTLIKAHSLGQENDNLTTVFAHWQPHFDRDFSSLTELFNIPVFSPGDLTARLARRTSNRFEVLNTAGSRFLNPKLPVVVTDYTSDTVAEDEPTPPSPPTPDRDNRWYRLLEFLEVPSRSLRHYDTPSYTVDAGKPPSSLDPNPELRAYREPGDLNLNTIRHATVLAGLLDDPLLSLNYSTTTAATPSAPWGLIDIQGNRNWWLEFLNSRDGFDPLPAASGGTSPKVRLPGVPRSGTSPILGSRPFRDLGFGQRVTGTAPNQTTIDSINDTVLRSLPSDGVNNPRGLFEVGTKLDHNNQTIDHTAKHRLLAKVMNNTTTRSNVFLVFIEIGFFEAKEVPSNLPAPNDKVVRIGAELANEPHLRGFFVIDRSKAMDSIRSQYIPRVWKDSNGVNRFTFSFYNYNQDNDFHIPMDYQPMILHREIIQQ